MPCYHPLRAARRPDGTIRIIPKGCPDKHQMKLACGQCIGCRLSQSRDWATRLMHETQTCDELEIPTCFVTLTYDPEHLPFDYSLDKSHFQNFMKSLRNKYPDRNIKYFHCGEYGEQLSRPHYHALLFGIDFEDSIFHSKTNKMPLFTSEKLTDIWKNGYTTIGNITYESAAYVARYVTKKINGPEASEHYLTDCPITGKTHTLQPEYITMSLKPEGLGARFYKKYTSDMYPHGTCVVNGHEVQTPRYYDKLYELENPDGYKKLKLLRAEQAALLEDHPDNTPKRLKTREKCHIHKSRLLKRSYENS